MGAVCPERNPWHAKRGRADRLPAAARGTPGPPAVRHHPGGPSGRGSAPPDPRGPHGAPELSAGPPVKPRRPAADYYCCDVPPPLVAPKTGGPYVLVFVFRECAADVRRCPTCGAG